MKEQAYRTRLYELKDRLQVKLKTEERMYEIDKNNFSESYGMKSLARIQVYQEAIMGILEVLQQGNTCGEVYLAVKNLEVNKGIQLTDIVSPDRKAVLKIERIEEEKYRVEQFINDRRKNARIVKTYNEVLKMIPDNIQVAYMKLLEG